MTTPLIPSRSRRYLRHGMLPQLAAFEAVVRLGSATRAAESLCMAQPTVSGHLRKLGDTLDVRLFARQGKHLVPTAAALALLGAAREVFASLERCEQVLVDLRAPPRPGTGADERALAATPRPPAATLAPHHAPPAALVRLQPTDDSAIV